MNDAQTWTAIGGLLSVILLALGLVVRLVDTTLSARFSAADEKMAAGFSVVNTRLDGLSTTMNDRFERVETRLDRVETRLDGIDRDINGITRRLFNGDA